jgi:glutamyl-Q tRNA(Asp) synthetase
LHSDSPASPTTIRQTYTGRFAPSPTGPLHLGSLFTALASFLDARANRGKWLLRIDDLDTPRNQPGAAADILRCLETFGLHWDDAVYYQSRHLPDYQGYLDELASRQLVYRCACSRKMLAEFSRVSGSAAAVYPGVCRDSVVTADQSHALRVKTDDGEIALTDVLQGGVIARLAKEQGDFILRRRDGIIAYQFAVVIDDHLQNISHIVRGRDLLVETPKQVYLQKLLGFQIPSYAHVPVIVGRDGNKLSKQTLASAVDAKNPAHTLFQLLVLLKQNPPVTLQKTSIEELLQWGIAHWRPGLLRQCENIPQQSEE